MLRNSKVVILGGGIAGTSCAISLLREGFDTTIIERSLSAKNLPGETVHPGIQTLLRQLDVLDVVLASHFKRNTGIDVSDQGGAINQHFYNQECSWEGFQLIRKEFDSILLNKCYELRGTVLKGERPLKLKFDSDGQIQSVITDEREITANVFIDATGRAAWLARMLKKEYSKVSRQLIAYYGLVENDKEEHFKNPRLIWDKESWTWLSEVNASTISWAYLHKDNGTKISRTWIPKELGNARIIEPRRAADVTWKIAKNAACSNHFLLGDAAFTVDPISGNGILKAMMSGIMTAYLLGQSSSLMSAQREYRNWIAEWFAKDSIQLFKLYEEKGWDLNVMMGNLSH
ncbi:MAG: NAD(P)/FAD-dependent oxidoreductase [Bacteroidota bacterium]